MSWNDNDDNMFLTITSANNLGDRIDAVVVEVDSRDESRLNSIRIIDGVAVTANPVRPTMVNDEFVRQCPLAYIRVNRGVTHITQADITNMVGTSEFPFVTGPLETMNVDDLISQWQAQWLIQFNNQQTQWQKQTNNQQDTWQQKFDVMNTNFLELINLVHSVETGLFVLINNNFDDWSVRRGCRFRTIPQSEGFLETITITATNFLMAQRVTTYTRHPNGQINTVFEVVVFRPTSMEETFGETTRTILTTGITLTRVTRFDADGSVTADVFGQSSASSLLDSNLDQIIDSAMSKLLVWE